MLYLNSCMYVVKCMYVFVHVFCIYYVRILACMYCIYYVCLHNMFYMYALYVCIVRMYVCMYVCNLIRWIPSGSFRSCLRMWTCARSVRWRRSSSPCCSCPDDPSTDKVRLTHTYFFLIIKSMYVCIHVCMYVGCRFTKRGLDENGNAANFVVCYCMYVCMHVFNCLILYVCMYVCIRKQSRF